MRPAPIIGSACGKPVRGRYGMKLIEQATSSSNAE